MQQRYSYKNLHSPIKGVKGYIFTYIIKILFMFIVLCFACTLSFMPLVLFDTLPRMPNFAIFALFYFRIVVGQMPWLLMIPVALLNDTLGSEPLGLSLLVWTITMSRSIKFIIDRKIDIDKKTVEGLLKSYLCIIIASHLITQVVRLATGYSTAPVQLVLLWIIEDLVAYPVLYILFSKANNALSGIIYK